MRREDHKADVDGNNCVPSYNSGASLVVYHFPIVTDSLVKYKKPLLPFHRHLIRVSRANRHELRRLCKFVTSSDLFYSFIINANNNRLLSDYLVGNWNATQLVCVSLVLVAVTGEEEQNTADSFVQFAKIVSEQQYQFGFERGNEDHRTARHESLDGPRFQTRVSTNLFNRTISYLPIN